MSENLDEISYHWYDYGLGWENTNSGWYTASLISNNQHTHREAVEWMFEKIDNPRRHARWISFEGSSEFRFRYERDYILFTLRWS